jgi:hypothetical protein
MLNNNLDNIILIICIGLIMNFLYFTIIKCINGIISLFSKDRKVSLYKYMFFTNYFGFINDLQLKSLLELFLMNLSDYHYPRDPKCFKVSIIFCQINPSTKLYYPISEECIFDFQVTNPISSDELYNLIKNTILSEI